MSKRLEIDISIADQGWSAALWDVENICQSAAGTAFEMTAHGETENAEVSILLTDDSQMRSLNRDYRNRDQATNVLSFAGTDEGKPFATGPVLLGDIVVALGVCSREAKNEKKSMADHLAHLVIHGMLHLLGYDHEIEEDAEKMESLEIEALAKLGVADPYTESNQGASR